MNPELVERFGERVPELASLVAYFCDHRLFVAESSFLFPFKARIVRSTSEALRFIAEDDECDVHRA